MDGGHNTNAHNFTGENDTEIDVHVYLALWNKVLKIKNKVVVEK